MLAVGLVEAPRLARVVRNAVMSVREETYVEASMTVWGLSVRLLLQHIVPNIRSVLIVYVVVFMARAAIAEASLSFLGLGVQYPEASWGSRSSPPSARISIGPLS